MAQAQGFDKSINFAESDTGASDRRILSNLIETGVEGDFILFANNLRDFSEVPSAAYSLDGTSGTITIVQEGYLPFSDTTEVTVITYPNANNLSEGIGGVPGDTYEVFQSNAIDSFKLKDELGNTVTSGFDGALQTLRRKDIVSFGNLTNLKVTRIPAVDASLQGEAGLEEGNSTVFGSFDITGTYDAVDSSVSILQFTKQGVPRTYEDSIFPNKNLVFSGNVRIMNTRNVAVSNPINEDIAPGLYIKAGESAKRAFSDTSNPWTGGTDADVGNALITQADSATIGDMKLYGSTPVFEGAWASSAATESGSISDWTHKIPVKINNGATTLFLLVKT